MKRFNNAAEMARDAKMDTRVVEETFQRYNEAARAKKDEFGRLCALLRIFGLSLIALRQVL